MAIAASSLLQAPRRRIADLREAWRERPRAVRLSVSLALCCGLLAFFRAGPLTLGLACFVAQAALTWSASAQGRAQPLLTRLPQLLLLRWVGVAGLCWAWFAPLPSVSAAPQAGLAAAAAAVLAALVYAGVLLRGGERLAQLHARFGLDALAGEQTRIEQERRSGTLGPLRATVSRSALSEDLRLRSNADGLVALLRAEAPLILLAIFAASAGPALHQQGLGWAAVAQAGPVILLATLPLVLQAQALNALALKTPEAAAWRRIVPATLLLLVALWAAPLVALAAVLLLWPLHFAASASTPPARPALMLRLPDTRDADTLRRSLDAAHQALPIEVAPGAFHCAAALLDAPSWCAAQRSSLAEASATLAELAARRHALRNLDLAALHEGLSTYLATLPATLAAPFEGEETQRRLWQVQSRLAAADLLVPLEAIVTTWQRYSPVAESPPDDYLEARLSLDTWVRGAEAAPVLDLDPLIAAELQGKTHLGGNLERDLRNAFFRALASWQRPTLPVWLVPSRVRALLAPSVCTWHPGTLTLATQTLPAHYAIERVATVAP